MGEHSHRAAKRPIGDYFSENFHITKSGNLSTPALQHAIAELGPERIMFSADYPFEDLLDAAAWFDNSGLDAEYQIRIGRTNATRLLKL